EMRIQFGTLLADIGLITLPKFNQVLPRQTWGTPLGLGWSASTHVSDTFY
ncbi:hypothetical protein A2U01_0027125, partial [Trifolium medium]|nr:hypothetical protein [Trifolium medium]